MVGYRQHLRTASARATFIGMAAIALLGLFAARATTLMAGTKTGAVIALLTTLGPPLAYLCVIQPIIFPLGLYAVLVPLDGLLDFTALGTLTKVVAGLTIFTLLLYMIRTKKGVEPANSTAWWILLYLWATASLFWALDVPTSEQMLPTELQLFALYLVTAMFPMTLKGVRTIVAFIVAGAAIAGAYGVYFYHSQAPAGAARLVITTDTGGLNPDHFGASLILPIALAASALVWTRNIWAKLACLFALTAMLWSVDLTGSRGAALAVVAVFMYLLVRDRARKQLAIFVGTVVTVILAVSGASLFQRFSESLVHGGAGRTYIWQIGLQAFMKYWLFGAGYGNFPQAYNTVFMNVFEPMYTNWSRASHNILLHAAVELGIIGLALLVLAWVGQFRLISVVDAENPMYPLRLALEGALIGLFVAGQFADIMTMKYTWLAFMLVALVRNAALSERKDVRTCATAPFRTAVRISPMTR